MKKKSTVSNNIVRTYLNNEKKKQYFSSIFTLLVWFIWSKLRLIWNWYIKCSSIILKLSKHEQYICADPERMSLWENPTIYEAQIKNANKNIKVLTSKIKTQNERKQ